MPLCSLFAEAYMWYEQRRPCKVVELRGAIRQLVSIWSLRRQPSTSGEGCCAFVTLFDNLWAELRLMRQVYQFSSCNGRQVPQWPRPAKTLFSELCITWIVIVGNQQSWTSSRAIVREQCASTCLQQSKLETKTCRQLQFSLSRPQSTTSWSGRISSTQKQCGRQRTNWRRWIRGVKVLRVLLCWVCMPGFMPF